MKLFKKIKKRAILVFLLIGMIAFLFLNTIIIQVQGDSMLPAIKSGQYIIATRISSINSGDVLLVHFLGRNSNDIFVKRLVATENQSIKIQNSKVFVNGKLFLFGDSSDWTKNNNFNVNGGAFVIPRGYVFALGDNRNYSQDSRNLGLASVVARVIFVI
jgi:signal peptidase I